MRLRTLLLTILASGSILAAQQGTSRQVEWLVYRGDQAGSNSSPLADITAANVQRLRIAWQWEHGEQQHEQYKEALFPGAGTVPSSFETQPLMQDGVVYVTTPYNNAAALDAETGKELWRFDGEAYKLGPISDSGFKHRGAAFWRDGNRLRVFLNTRNRLFSLDAQTGKMVNSFGDNGFVSLTDQYPRPISGESHITVGSAPVVFKDLIIVGSAQPDRIQVRNVAPGIVQAFNAHTGRRAWMWTAIPLSPKDFGAETWENESYRIFGANNVWGPMTLDESRGLLYFGTSSPSVGHYGGHRPGANVPAESLVCLDAATGQRKWSFQLVHHPVWGYDNPAPPNLVTITVDGRRIDAVAQVTKQGFTYVFDRVTGQPVWPIVERPVATDSDVPGEKLSPTQPFPTKPPPFSKQGVLLEDTNGGRSLLPNDLTPEIKALAQAEMQKHRVGPLFTPPSLRGTLDAYGANWGGAAFDAQTGYLFVRGSNVIRFSRVHRNDPPIPNIDPTYDYSDYAAGEAAPSGRSALAGLPMTRPPYATLTAIDLNKGEFAWQVPLGEGSRTMRNHPLLKGVTLPERLGSGTEGGALVTAGGLVFIGGGDGYLYAFDKNTGKELWRGTLPNARANAVPMTYRTRAGRQFVVIATGAGPDGILVAFALDGN